MRPALAREAAEADAALGVDLYGCWRADAEDTVFSPASVASALRMALCGASGQTAAELARCCTSADTRSRRTSRPPA